MKMHYYYQFLLFFYLKPLTVIMFDVQIQKEQTGRQRIFPFTETSSLPSSVNSRRHASWTLYDYRNIIFLLEHLAL